MPRNMGVQGYLPRASTIRRNTQSYKLRQIGRKLGLSNAMIDQALNETGRVHQTLGSFSGGASTSRVRFGGGRSGVRDSSGLGFNRSADASAFRNFRMPIAANNRLNQRAAEAFAQIKAIESMGGRLTDSQKNSLLRDALGPEKGGLVFGKTGKGTIPGGAGRGITKVGSRGLDRALSGGLSGDDETLSRHLAALQSAMSTRSTTSTRASRRKTLAERRLEREFAEEQRKADREARLKRGVDIAEDRESRLGVTARERLRQSDERIALARDKFDFKSKLKRLSRKDKDRVYDVVGDLMQRGNVPLDMIPKAIAAIKSGADADSIEAAYENQVDVEESKARQEKLRGVAKSKRKREADLAASSGASMALDMYPEVFSSYDIDTIKRMIQNEFQSGNIQDFMAEYGMTQEQAIANLIETYYNRKLNRAL